LQITKEFCEEITEGSTKIIVPKKSITDLVPPKDPAFFNPKAKETRDVSIIIYKTFLKNFKGPKVFLEGLSGVGARGLRVANEIQVEKVVINDLNPSGLELAKFSAELNNLNNIEFSQNDICRFLSLYSKKGNRGSIVDIDPFGSSAEFFDCGLRATMHGGILSCTSTDLQVLHGLFQKACKRKYGGIPIRTKYGNEIAIRLILGCLGTVAGRLGIEIIPIFVESSMHYYRTYVKVFNRIDQKDNLGFINHCTYCGNRVMSLEKETECEICKSPNISAGPLWIGKIFNKEFLQSMFFEFGHLESEKTQTAITKCLSESDMPGTYFTLDEIAARMRGSPIKLQSAITKLQEKGFVSSPTSFSPTGFRTNAKINEIISIFS
jgi:tRNA (guanine26-N2/guanine27-N2)-dimethyltransferase